MQQWRDDIVDYLGRLRLTIHPGAHVRPVSEGFPFLGFVVAPERRRLRRRKGVHFVRSLKRLVAARNRGDAPQSALTASIRGWVNHVRYANTVGLRKAVLRSAVVRPTPQRPMPEARRGPRPNPVLSDNSSPWPTSS